VWALGPHAEEWAYERFVQTLLDTTRVVSLEEGFEFL